MKESEVSLIVLARGHSESLRSCLTSVEEVDHKLVLLADCDDVTREIARAYGDVVLEETWPGRTDFDLNTLLDHVATPWVFRLNADENFASNQEGLLRELVASEDQRAFSVKCNEKQADGLVMISRQMRLWRNHPMLRYTGRVLEHIPQASFDAAYPELKGGESDIVIERAQQKGPSRDEEFVKLLKQELAENPESVYYRAVMAKIDLDAGRTQGLQATGDLAAHLLKQDDAALRREAMAPWILATALYQLEMARLQSPFALSLVDRMSRLFWDVPHCMWVLGDHYEQIGDGRAESIYLRMRDTARNGTFRLDSTYDPAILGTKLEEKLATLRSAKAVKQSSLLDPENLSRLSREGAYGKIVTILGGRDDLDASQVCSLLKALWHLGRVHDALLVARKYPLNDDEVRIERAYAYIHAGFFEDARKIALEVSQESRYRSNALAQAADCSVSLKQYDKAIVYCQEALTLDSEYEDAIGLYLKALWRSGQVEMMTDLLRSLEGRSGGIGYTAERIEAICKMQGIERARIVIAECLDSLGRDVTVLKAAAKVELDSGNPDTAVTYYSEALSLLPEQPSVLGLRAMARWKSGDKKGGIADATRAVELAPTSEGATRILAWMLIRSWRPVDTFRAILSCVLLRREFVASRS